MYVCMYVCVYMCVYVGMYVQCLLQKGDGILYTGFSIYTHLIFGVPLTVHLYKEELIFMFAKKLRKQVHTREQRYFGLLRGEYWHFLTDVSGTPIDPRFCSETSVRNCTYVCMCV